MRQNPKWILLSEVRSAEAVSAVRNSISSGHNILSTIHADKAASIPYRLYSLMETDLEVGQFLNTIYRYIQIGVHIKAYYSKKYGKFHREVDEVTEFYVDDNNNPVSRTIYRKTFDSQPMMIKPSEHLIEYLENQNIDVSNIVAHLPDKMPVQENSLDGTNLNNNENTTEAPKENPSEAQPVVPNEAPTVEPIKPTIETQPATPAEATKAVEPVKPTVEAQTAKEETPLEAVINYEKDEKAAKGIVKEVPQPITTNPPVVAPPAVTLNENNPIVATVNAALNKLDE